MIHNRTTCFHTPNGGVPLAGRGILSGGVRFTLGVVALVGLAAFALDVRAEEDVKEALRKLQKAMEAQQKELADIGKTAIVANPNQACYTVLQRI